MNAVFEVVQKASRMILTIRLQGFWDLAQGRRFEKQFQKEAEKISQQETPWCLLLDLRRYPPQLPEVQGLLGRTVFTAETAGMEKRATLVNDSLAPLQNDLLPRGAEAQLNFYFRSEDDALRWLADEPEK